MVNGSSTGIGSPMIMIRCRMRGRRIIA